MALGATGPRGHEATALMLGTMKVALLLEAMGGATVSGPQGLHQCQGQGCCIGVEGHGVALVWRVGATGAALMLEPRGATLT